MNLGKFELDNIYNENAYLSIKLIPDKSIDLIIIDPPYLMSCHSTGGAFGRGRQKFHDELKNLNIGIDYSILNDIVRVMKKINIYIFCNKNQILGYLMFFAKQKNIYFDLLTWHKLNPIPTCNNKYLSDTEYILFFREKGVKVYGTYKTKSKYFITQKNLKDKRLYNHPTIKPLEIIKTLINNSSEEKNIVADFFIGSGTTAVASKILNRHFIGFEINKNYYETSKKRLKEINEQEELEIEI